MKLSKFTAVCPYEIGDTVYDRRTGRYRTITDIACVQYLKSGNVEFLYELDNFPNFVRISEPTKGVSVTITFEK